MVRKEFEITDPESGRVNISSRTVFDYQMRPAQGGHPRELILLLHGYAEAGKKIFSKLISILPPDAVILAPNGPFPMPYKTDEGFKLGYSWYFYDPVSKEYFIDMSVPVDFLDQGIRLLKLDGLPKRIIGFSQGGYLAPIAAHYLKGVSQVVGIGCEFLADELPTPTTFRIDGVHGELDEVTKAEEVRKSYQDIKRLGIDGELHLLPGVGHRITPEVLSKVGEIIG